MVFTAKPWDFLNRPPVTASAHGGAKLRRVFDHRAPIAAEQQADWLRELSQPAAPRRRTVHLNGPGPIVIHPSTSRAGVTSEPYDIDIVFVGLPRVRSHASLWLGDNRDPK